jgi:hypothetical protein
MIGIAGESWFWLLTITGAAALFSVAVRGFLQSAWLRSFLLGATNGLCAAYAGLAVPLSMGLSITQLPVQLVVGACVVVGCVLGWLSPARLVPLALAVGGLLSFAATLQAITLLYPPRIFG